VHAVLTLMELAQPVDKVVPDDGEGALNVGSVDTRYIDESL